MPTQLALSSSDWLKPQVTPSSHELVMRANLPMATKIGTPFGMGGERSAGAEDRSFCARSLGGTTLTPPSSGGASDAGFSTQAASSRQARMRMQPQTASRMPRQVRDFTRKALYSKYKTSLESGRAQLG